MSHLWQPSLALQLDATPPVAFKCACMGQYSMHVMIRTSCCKKLSVFI